MNPQTTTEEQQLQQRFDELPSEIMDLINGGTLDATMFTLQETYDLTPDQVRLIENEIILVLSFFADRADFVVNIQAETHLDETIAEAIGLDVETEIFELVEEYFDAVATARATATQETPKTEAEKVLSKKASLAALAESFEKRTPQTSAQVTTASEATQTLSEVEPLRTMQGDIKKIHGYGAFNEAKEKGEL